MTVLYGVPNVDQPIMVKGTMDRTWYRFFNSLYQGQAAQTEIAVTLNASPYRFVAPSGGFLIVRGGTVSALQFVRSATTLLPSTSGVFPVSLGDTIVVTYSATPTLVFVPQ